MSKRELIEPNEGDRRYIHRDDKGRISESVDLNRSLSRDDQHNSKQTRKLGEGDEGDGHTGDRKPGK